MNRILLLLILYTTLSAQPDEYYQEYTTPARNRRQNTGYTDPQETYENSTTTVDTSQTYEFYPENGVPLQRSQGTGYTNTQEEYEFDTSIGIISQTGESYQGNGVTGNQHRNDGYSTTQKIQKKGTTYGNVPVSHNRSQSAVIPVNRTTAPTASSSPEMSQEVMAVQETPDIPLFSHQAHIEDVGAECVQCHQTLFSESVRGIKSGPPMKEICSQCHNGSDAPSEVLAGFPSEKKYVKTYLPLFSHTKHIQQTEECITCHRDIYQPLKKIQTPPPMKWCSECHNDYRANSSCNACHEHPDKLQPKSHTSRWVYRNGHGKEARLQKRECTGCHTDRQCNACHRGQTTFEVHRPGYKYAHGMDVRQRVTNCGYCHDAQVSCVQCHERKR